VGWALHIILEIEFQLGIIYILIVKLLGKIKTKRGGYGFKSSTKKLG